MQPKKTHVAFEVPNMNCDHCVATIREALSERGDGVEMDADLDWHRLNVTLANGRITAEGVEETLAELGYDARRVG